MRQWNAIKKLRADGYNVEYGKFGYWEDRAYVESESGKKTFLVNYHNSLRTQGIGWDNKKNSYGMIIEAIEHEANFLYYVDEDYKPFREDSQKWNKSWEVRYEEV